MNRFSSKKLGKWVMLMRPGRMKMLRSYEQGQVPGDFLYGFLRLREAISNMEMIEFDATGKGQFPGSWVLRFERRLSSFLLFDLRLFIGNSVSKILRDKDLVISNIDSIALSCAFYRWLVPTPTKQLHISQGLTNELDLSSNNNLHFWVRKHMTAWFVSQLDHVLVLGQGARYSYLKHKLCPPSTISCLQFGVDTTFWCPSKSLSVDQTTENPYILSVGSDAGRDYATLLAATRDIDLTIVSSISLTESSGVKQVSDIDDFELRDLYRNALLVVIPLEDISQPSGQSASLQAMACGKTVLISDTRGFWDRNHLRHGEHLWMVPPSDSRSLSDAIEFLLKNQSLLQKIGERANAVVAERYDMDKMGNQLLEVCQFLSRESRNLLV